MLNLIIILVAYIVFTIIGIVDIVLFVIIYNNGIEKLYNIENNKIISVVVSWRKNMLINHIDNYMKRDGWIKFNGKKESIIFLNIILHVIAELCGQVFFIFVIYVNLMQ